MRLIYATPILMPLFSPPTAAVEMPLLTREYVITLLRDTAETAHGDS